MLENCGHRERLRQKFLQYSHSFSENDILELILFFAIPRKDTRLIAKKLLREHNNLITILSNANTIESTILTSNSRSILYLIYKLAIYITESKVKTSIPMNINDIIKLYQIELQSKTVEEIHIVILNSKKNVIYRNLLNIGTISTVSIQPRNIIKLALRFAASEIILIHNHPNGNPEPSYADIDITKRIYDSLKTIDIVLRDHVIIGHNKYYSFRENHIVL